MPAEQSASQNPATVARAPEVPHTPVPAPKKGDLVRILPTATGSAAAYAGDTVPVFLVDADGSIYILDHRSEDSRSLVRVDTWAPADQAFQAICASTSNQPNGGKADV